jgi:hypothetical protein
MSGPLDGVVVPDLSRALSLSVTMSRMVMPLSGVPADGVRYALCRRVSATWCRPGSTTRHSRQRNLARVIAR